LVQKSRFFVILSSFFAAFLPVFWGWTVLIDAKSPFSGQKSGLTPQKGPNFD